MQREFRALLRADAVISAAVGGRIDWTGAAQEVGEPSIRLHLVSGGRSYHSTGPAGLFQDRVQLDIWTLDAESRAEIGWAVEALLSGFRGDRGATAFRGVFIDFIRETGGEMKEGGAYLYRRQIDFMINWKRIV
ncbi:tail completion protein gp17 [Pseudooceanicola algae]|uniref:DUF3168 domain-containing protein n=1 Tax=Pseudooceanicola algae TaxID=1537215 RepID=A0A418SDS5_9RHOB|nr:DUF3168 domain-containing protein [Pseudooceanicola algae]QPM89381.1 hypothetical protein PSAL_005970 [Pseudooceanicola algae]